MVINNNSDSENLGLIFENILNKSKWDNEYKQALKDDAELSIDYSTDYRYHEESNAQNVVDRFLISSGFTFHRGKNPTHSDWIVLFCDDPMAISSYGQEQWVVHKGRLLEIPQYIYDFAERFYRSEWNDEWGEDFDIDNLFSSINPIDIVNSAGVWDDTQFVSELWNEFEYKFLNDGIIGFKTHDGGVVFPGFGEPDGIINANAVVYDEFGKIKTLSERFSGYVK